MNKNTIIGGVIAALLINSVSPVMAAIPDTTVVLGEKAYSLEYAENVVNRKEILEAINQSQGKIYLKLGNKWLTNEKGPVDINTIPAVTYKNKDGNETKYEKCDGDEIKEEVVEELKIEEFKATGSKDLRVIFNKPVEDKSVLNLKVQLNNINIQFAEVKWNEANTEVYLKAPYNLRTGEYVATIKVDNQEKQYKTNVEEAKLSNVKVIGDAAYIVGGTSNKKLKIQIELQNQYGEKWTEVGSNFNAMISPSDEQKATVDSKAGIVTANYKFGYKVGDTITLSIIEFKSGLNISKTLKVQDGAKISRISLGNVFTNNANYKDEPVYKSNLYRAEYYIPIEAFDEKGRQLTKEELEGQIIAFPNNDSSPVYLEGVNNNEAKIYTIDEKTVLKIRPGKTVFAGDFRVNVFTKETNVKQEVTVKVLEDHIIDKFELQYPQEEIYVGKEVEIPFRAVSNYGKILTTPAEIQLKYQQQENTWLTNIELMDGTRISTDGTAEIMLTTDYKANKRIIKLRAINKYVQKTTINVFTKTGTNSMLALDILEAAEPRDIHGVSSDLMKFVEKDMSIVQTIYDKNNGTNMIDIKDQYGKLINLSSDYRITVSSDNSNDAIRLLGNKPMTDTSGNIETEHGKPLGYIIDGSANNFIKVQSGGSEGIEYLVFRLEKMTNGRWEIIDEELVKMEAVNPQYIESYSLKLSGSEKLYTGAHRVGQLYTDDENAISYEVVGYYYGNEVKLRQDGRVIAGVTGGLDAKTQGKIKPNIIDTNGLEQRAMLTVVYQGVTNMQTITREIPYSSESPRTIDIKILNSQGVEIGDTAVISRDKLIKGVDITSRNDAWFKIIDQYGITMPKNCTITAGNQLSSNGVTEKKFVTVAGTLISIDNTAQVGDSFNIILITNDGILKTLKVIVGN